MTDNDHTPTDVFLHALSLLTFNDDGLDDANDLDDIETTTRLCAAVKAATADANTPMHRSLHRLAERTEDMLITWVHPNEPAVRAWLIARGEFLQLRLAANR